MSWWRCFPKFEVMPWPESTDGWKNPRDATSVPWLTSAVMPSMDVVMTWERVMG